MQIIAQIVFIALASLDIAVNAGPMLAQTPGIYPPIPYGIPVAPRVATTKTGTAIINSTRVDVYVPPKVEIVSNTGITFTSPKPPSPPPSPPAAVKTTSLTPSMAQNQNQANRGAPVPASSPPAAREATKATH
jgi:hypothetical protein